MISCGVSRASLEYALYGDCGVVAASYFERSLASLKSVGAALQTEQIRLGRRTLSSNRAGYDTYISPVVYGKEKFYHALSISKLVNESVIISSEERKEADFFNYLMHKYDYPLLEEWKKELCLFAGKKGYIRTGVLSGVVYGENYKGKSLNVRVYDIVMTEEDLKSMVSELLMSKRIYISHKETKKLNFTNMDEYFKNYGHSLVENLEKQIHPLHSLDGNINCLALNNMKLYPQQAAQVNGVIDLLNSGSSYAILNMGMGTGKTICSASMVEGFFVKKEMDVHSSVTLKDIYQDDRRIHYRNIVMCPGHLVEKWKSEIAREIPYAKVSVIHGLEQLVEIEKRGRARTEKEWYIISKDAAKLSYQSIPVPSRCGRKRIKVRVCDECHTMSESSRGERFQCKCGSDKYHIQSTSNYGWGMLCPNCNEVLLSNGKIRLGEEGDGSGTSTLTPNSFTNPTGANQRCHLCGTELWRPHIRNINEPGTEFYEMANRHSKWHRATHYANKTHKSTKSVWVHTDFEHEYFASINEIPLRTKSVDDKGVRKYAPASYIKKKLKGFFDVFVLDEAHLFKGGATAQGNAMHALVKASKYQLALTGTIAGGMATHLFYLLYRLNPSRMKEKGYEWTDEMKFAHAYGTVERTYSTGDEGASAYNQSSKGKQLGSPKVKPGISPLIFRDFLLDRTVFLDLSDMSKYLPPLKEFVVSVDVPETVTDDAGNEIQNPELVCHRSYKSVIDSLKKIAREEGRGVLSMMLQFSLSYLDKPYGVEPIKSPNNGVVLAKPDDFHCLIENGGLLAKERKLVGIINKELGESRNCVVFCEYTNSPQTCVTHRLKEVLMRHCGLSEKEVTIIESTSPVAAKREAWMHDKAEKGTKVFIVNPRCVETGLDFCWSKDGKLYNYPSLIFYQLGYSLFTIWQASRRAYRLNQREECRTYYMGYSGTVQQAVISLIAEKQAATSAIQGKFSTEGLSAMAQGVDVKVKLAQALADMDSITGNGLQEMFDVLNQDTTDMSAYGDYVPMLTFRELMGEDIVVDEQENAAQSMMDALSGMLNFETFINSYQKMAQTEKTPDAVSGHIVNSEKRVSRREQRMRAAGQMTLFD